jgi:acetyl-CoA acyltransferase 2
MAFQSEDVVILDGARTPVGTFMGALKGITATELGAHAARAAIERTKVDANDIDAVYIGNVVQSSTDAVYIARHVGLKAGIPIGTPALTVNRLCGSGLEAILQAARSIRLGEARLVLAGGTENMSQAPFAMRGARDGWGLGGQQVEDTLWSALSDLYGGCSMAETAENLAEQYQISREEQDEFSYRSHALATQAREKGRLALEIAPVTIKGKKGDTVVAHDEHIRPDTTREKLATLPARFRQNGTVTAGNASGINDAAAVVLVSSYGYAKERGLPILGRIVSWGIAGVDPKIMGIGPAPATRMALERAGMSIGQLDVIEANEAFAAQYLAVEKELGWDRNKANLNGGGISIGHPLAATGARVTLSALYELREQNKQYALSTMCIGGGQGIAAILERE